MPKKEVLADVGISVQRANEAEKLDFARQANIARRHLTQEEKREAIRKRLAETPEKSDRQIAADLNVSNKTVSSARKEMVDTGQVCNLHTSKGADGKTYPRQTERKPISIFHSAAFSVALCRQFGLLKPL